MCTFLKLKYDRYNLRAGDFVIGQARPPRETERHFGVTKVDSINGMDPDEAKDRPNFENLTPIFPNERFDLEIKPNCSFDSAHQFNCTDWQRPTRDDCFSPKSRKNNHFERYCKFDFNE